MRPTTTRMRLGVLATGLALGACSPGPLDAPLTGVARRDLGRLDALEQDLLDRADGEPGGRAARDPLDATSADDFVRLALERNPSLRAAEQHVLRLRERVPQASSLDDPRVTVTPIGDMAETAAGQVRVMTGVSQRLPYPGKLDQRGRVAEQDVAIAEQELERTRLSVIADTRRAYWSLYGTVRAMEITRRSRDLLDQLRGAAEAKYRAGTATQEQVLRASVELSGLDNELIELEQRRASAAGMLNSMVDRPVNAPVPNPAPIELSRFDARLADLLADAENSSPSIRAARERITRSLEQRRLARLDRFPDLTVSLSYNLVDDSGLSPVADGQDQWWLGFGVNVPIWADRLDAAEREATRGMLESAGRLADERNRVAFRVHDAFARVESQQHQAELLRDTIVPQARLAVEASLGGYRSGETDFLSIIDNWRKLLGSELMYQNTLSELERGFAELQQAVGRDLDRADTTEPREGPTPPTPEVQP